MLHTGGRQCRVVPGAEGELEPGGDSCRFSRQRLSFPGEWLVSGLHPNTTLMPDQPLACFHRVGRSTSQAISRMLPVLTTVKIQSA
jgi:hypothetical protein